MLTQQEILKEIFTLPPSEQREIAGKISRNADQLTEKDADETDKFRRELSVDERVAIALSLSGCLKPEAGYTPMTKEEEREIIEEYLAEKYS